LLYIPDYILIVAGGGHRLGDEHDVKCGQFASFFYSVHNRAQTAFGFVSHNSIAHTLGGSEAKAKSYTRQGLKANIASGISIAFGGNGQKLRPTEEPLHHTA
jgi:hypothetical protein